MCERYQSKTALVFVFFYVWGNGCRSLRLLRHRST